MTPQSEKAPPPTGLGVDRHGGPVVDPTANVIALNDAATKRQDDLRGAHALFVAAELNHLREVSELRAKHAEEIRRLEADRLDKIRQVDVSNAAATAAQLLAAVQTLASTAQATAETLRNQVAATAAAVASQTERVVNPIIERIALLEKSSYTGAGKMAVTDPQMTELLAEMKAQRQMASVSAGKNEGLSLSAALVMGAITIVSALVGIGGVFYAVLK